MANEMYRDLHCINSPATIQYDNGASSATATVTLVTLSATYVCTPQFHVISRQPHTDMEQDLETHWTVLPKMEIGPNKPDQIVMT